MKQSFDKLSPTEILRPSLEEHQKQERFPIYAVLDNIRSLYNVGSIFRSSDALRLQKLYLCGMTAYPPRKEIDKTALGSVESVPWQYFSKTQEAIQEIREAGIPIIAVEQTKQSANYQEFKPTFPSAFVFGHEVTGVSQEVLNEADFAVEIPMYGIKHSFNIAVAYGIVLSHFLTVYQTQSSLENFFSLKQRSKFLKVS